MSPRRFITRSWWDRHWLKVCLIALFSWTTLGFALGFNERSDRINAAQQQAHRVGKFSVELRDGIVFSCQKNGNSLRRAVRKFGDVLVNQIQDDIEQSKALERSGTYGEIFPNISPAKLHELIEKSLEGKENDQSELSRVIKLARPVSCKAFFPVPPPGNSGEPSKVKNRSGEGGE